MKNEKYTGNFILDDKEDFSKNVAKNIGKKIRRLRNKYGIRGVDLAKVVGISQQQLSKYENGFGDLSVSKMLLISIYFNVDINYFFT